MISPVGSLGNANLFSAPLDGFQRSKALAGQAGLNIAKGQVTPENMVNLIQAEVLAKANAATVRTGDQMVGSLLNAVA